MSKPTSAPAPAPAPTPGYRNDGERDFEPAPLLSLPAFLLLVVIEAAWVWVLWKGINYLADRFLS